MNNQQLLICPATYYSYLNDFLTIDYFARYHNVTIEQAKSIVARSKISSISEAIKNGLYDGTEICKYNLVGEANRKAFTKRDNERLLSECSA